MDYNPLKISDFKSHNSQIDDLRVCKIAACEKVEFETFNVNRKSHIFKGRLWNPESG